MVVVVPGAPAGPLRRRALAALAGAVVLGVAGVGPGSLLVAVGVAVGVERLARRGAATGADDGARVRDDLPLVCDLLAVCLAAGTPVPGALGAVGAAAGGPLGRVLAGVAAVRAGERGVVPRPRPAPTPARVQGAEAPSGH